MTDMTMGRSNQMRTNELGPPITRTTWSASDMVRAAITRSVAVAGLAGIALIHLLDAPGKFSETHLIFAMYVLLIIGTLVVAGMLIHSDSRPAWVGAGVLAGLTILCFVLSRTTGLPTATDDIGNWGEPLGIASLFVEAIVVALSVYRLEVLPDRDNVTSP